MLPFVVLEHDSPHGVHFDFMLQVGETLKTWSLPEPPVGDSEIIGQELFDHRLKYLDYEGPIGSNRGSVTRWDRGTYNLLGQGDSGMVVELNGDKFTGKAVLRKDLEDPSMWRFTFSKTGSES